LNDGIVQYFGTGVFALCGMVMGFFGDIDHALGGVMTSIGIGMQWQFLIMLVVTAMLAVPALRYVGGLLGWVMMLLLVLLLVDSAVPEITAQDAPGSGMVADLL
jgi:hypothetical protein